MAPRRPTRPSPGGRPPGPRRAYLLAGLVALAGLVGAGAWGSLALIAGGAVRAAVWPALTGLASLAAGVLIAVRATDHRNPGD